MSFKRLVIVVFSFFCSIFLLLGFFSPTQAQTTSPDALGIRVIPNPEHKSARQWYEDQGFSGSPQEIVVDGYLGVRDGRTVYVNAANAVSGTAYTNIYLISYNQSADQNTQDIFAGLLKNWRFNTNIDSFGNCHDDTARLCETDEDCANTDFCISHKARLTRDVKRLEDIYLVRFQVNRYYEQNQTYPEVAAGSYLPHKTISVWPSWQKVLAQNFGQTLPQDPVNRLGDCGDPRFEETTCWDYEIQEFADTNQANQEINLPQNSLVMVYEGSRGGQSYNLCAVMESGYISGLGSGACDSSNQYSYNDDLPNTPPQVQDPGELVVCNEQELSIFVSASDINNDPLEWSFDFSPASQWSSWPSAPRFEPTPSPLLSRVYAIETGNIGTYSFSANVADGRGGEDSQVINFSVIDCSPPDILRVSNVDNGQVYYDVNNGQTGNFNIDLVIGRNLSLLVEAVDQEANYPLRFSFYNTPRGFNSAGWLADNEHDYTVSGVVVDYTQPYDIALVASDNGGARSAPLSFTVNLQNSAPNFSSSPPTDTRVCTVYNYQLNAQDPEGHSFEYQDNDSLPDELVFDQGNGQINGFVRDTGTYNINLSVEDQYYSYTRSPYEAASNQSFTLNVAPENFVVNAPANATLYTAPPGVSASVLYYPQIFLTLLATTNAEMGETWFLETTPANLPNNLNIAINRNSGIVNASAVGAEVGNGFNVQVEVQAENECRERHEDQFNINVLPNEWCGDDQINGPEECDDNNRSNEDRCLNDCRFSYCGDAYIQAPNGRGRDEACDDGNSSNHDECLNDCRLSHCGDGYIQQPNGAEQYEDCDDRNLSNNDACLNSCRDAFCGDGEIWNVDCGTSCEECEDGNLDNSDACLSDCSNAYCGDGYIRTGVEQCDGINLNGETCITRGFVVGDLTCSDCTIDASGCSNTVTIAVTPSYLPYFVNTSTNNRRSFSISELGLDTVDRRYLHRSNLVAISFSDIFPVAYSGSETRGACWRDVNNASFRVGASSNFIRNSGCNSDTMHCRCRGTDCTIGRVEFDADGYFTSLEWNAWNSPCAHPHWGFSEVVLDLCSGCN